MGSYRRPPYRAEFGIDDKPLSLRGISLIWDGGGDTPRMTVEDYEKWYELYIVLPTGMIEPIGFDEIDDNGGGSPYCDHVPNPDYVARFCRKRGIYLIDAAHERIVGRWCLEVLNQFDH